MIINKKKGPINYKKRVRNLIQLLGSQRKTAEKLNVNQSTISRILNDKIIKPNQTIKNKINSQISSLNQKYIFRYRLEVYTKDQGEFTIAGDYADYGALEKSYDNLIDKLTQSNPEIYVISTTVDVLKLNQ